MALQILVYLLCEFLYEATMANCRILSKVFYCLRLAGVIALAGLAVPAFAQVVPPGGIPRSAEADVVGRQAESLRAQPAEAAVDEAPGMAVKVPEGAEQVRFVLEKIEIEGGGTYTPEQLAESYEGMVGREVSLTEMYIVAARITQRYLADGYLISKAYLPPQSIHDGVVRIRIIEGYVNGLRWSGEPLENELAHNMAEKLTQQRPLTGKALEGVVLRLNDLPSLHVQATLSPAKDGEEGAVTVVLEVARKRFNAQIDVNNYASRYLGVWQSTLQGEIAGLLSAVDKLSLNVTGSVDTRYSQYGRAEYSIPVTTSGTVLLGGISQSRSKPGFRIQTLDIISEANTMWLGVTQPVLRSRLESLTLSSQLNIRNQNTEVLGVPFYEDRIRTLQLSGMYNLSDNWAGTNLLNLELTKGLDILDSTDTGSPMLSRAIGHSDFLKLVVNASRLQSLGPDFSLLAAVNGQKSDAPLLSSEQFGFGGSGFGRGYDSSEISGDEGIAGSVELRYSAVLDENFALQPYVFYDIGKVWSEGSHPVSAASAGLGVRMQVTPHAMVEMNMARPLTLPAATPKLGADGRDTRLNFSLRLTY